jgi:hypothetical protein
LENKKNMKEIDPHLPVDKTAAYVVSKSNELNSEFNPGNRITSMSPLPTTYFTGKKRDDLTGVKSGRFIVIGCALWRQRNHETQNNTTRWVAKCTCGRFQMFQSKTIKKNVGNMKFACVECEKTMSLARKASRDNNHLGDIYLEAIKKTSKGSYDSVKEIKK